MGNEITVAPGATQLPLYDNVSREACPSGFPRGKTAFLGGHDDELVSVPSFVGLDCFDDSVLPFYVRLWIAKGIKRSQKLPIPEGLEMLRPGYKAKAAPAVKARAGKKAGPTPAGSAPKVSWFDPIIRVLARKENVRPAKIAEEGKTLSLSTRAPATEAVPDGYVRISSAVAAGLHTHIKVEDLIKKLVRSPWLGILYDDAVRARPVGPVLGRLLYTMALGPGEEATLQQRSWTKRETMFEEVRDHETEQSLEYDSSWSTSFTTQFADEFTSSVKSQLSSKLGGTYEGISAEVGSGVSSDMGFKQTSSRQSQFTRQVSQKAALKAKQQHKTTFKVTTEIGSEFSSKRVLRNPNADSSLMLHFHKVLQKWHVMLERRDAYMCLRLFVPNPMRLLREAVLKELAKLDPVIPPDRGPQLGAESWSKIIKVTQFASGDWEAGLETNEITFSADVPQNYALTRLSGPNFVRARNENGDVVYEGDFGGFKEDGGKLGFSKVPPVGAEGRVEMTVSVTYPEPGILWNGTDVAEVDYEIELGGTLTSQVTADQRALREKWEAEERERIRQTFSAERLQALVSRDRYLGHLKGQAAERVFFPADFQAGTEPQSANVADANDIVLWDRFHVELFPWWLTPKGHEYRATLEAYAHLLPAEFVRDVRLWELLASPFAVVYLPLRPGREKDALAHLLRDANYAADIADCVSGFRSFHNSTFPPATPTQRDADDELSPEAAFGTPVGTADWEHEWERPRGRVILLDEWPETLPTDGVHIEPVVGACAGTSAMRHAQLLAELREKEANAAETESDALTKLASLPEGGQP